MTSNSHRSVSLVNPLVDLSVRQTGYFTSTYLPVNQSVRLCNRLGRSNFSVETSCPPNLFPAILCIRQTSVTSNPAVITGFEDAFLPVMVGTADISVTGNPAALFLPVMVGSTDYRVTSNSAVYHWRGQCW